MLTQRQREVYEFVVSYTDSHGYPPTVREIGEAVGLASPSTVHAHLANLERAGYLRATRRSRGPSSLRSASARPRERRYPCRTWARCACARWRDRRQRPLLAGRTWRIIWRCRTHALARRRGFLLG